MWQFRNMDFRSTDNGADVTVSSQQLDVSITFILETVLQGSNDQNVGDMDRVPVVGDAAISEDPRTMFLSCILGAWYRRWNSYCLDIKYGSHRCTVEATCK